MRSAFIALLSAALIASVPAQTARRQSTPRTPRSASSSSEAQSRRNVDEGTALKKLQDREIVHTLAFDIAAMLDLWTDDGVLIPPGHAPIMGKEAILKFLAAQREALGNTDILGLEENWQETRVTGDYGYQWGEIRLQTRTDQSNAQSEIVLNAMRILHRDEGGSWRFARVIWNEVRTDISVPKRVSPEGEER